MVLALSKGPEHPKKLVNKCLKNKIEHHGIVSPGCFSEKLPDTAELWPIF